MFRCDNCGSGYSAQAASSWTSCPRCLAKDKVQAPLVFELGWKRPQERPSAVLAPETRGSRAVEIT
jgi:hypothetical protein